MSKGGHGAAAANILLLKKLEESRKQETILREAIRVSTVQYSTVQYSTVQYSTVQYSTVQHSTVQYKVGPSSGQWAADAATDTSTDYLSTVIRC